MGLLSDLREYGWPPRRNANLKERHKKGQAYLRNEEKWAERTRKARPRVLTMEQARHDKHMNYSSPQSRLMSLPSELRTMIWEQAIGCQYIAIYREKDRMAHCLLDESNSQIPCVDLDTAVSYESIQNATKQLYEDPREANKKPPRSQKTNALSLLRTCRTIYSEGIDLLYTHNTFLFLQNRGPYYFSTTILPERFTALRFVHLHLLVRNVSSIHWNQTIWRLEDFDELLHGLHNMPHLEHVSLFVEGHVGGYKNLEWVLRYVDRLYEKLATKPKTFILRLPRPAYRYWEPLRDCVVDGEREQDEMIYDPRRKYRIVQPPRVPGRDMTDTMLGPDHGWRQGVVFIPPGNGSSDAMPRSYVVWTPLPRGLKWPSDDGPW